jgi:hypothetical protein
MKLKHFVQRWLEELPHFFLMKLPERWRLCIEVQGKYVEKLDVSF